MNIHLEKNKGNLFIVGLPIGNIEDITIRAIRILKEVDLILTEDTREFIKIAKHYDIKTKVHSCHQFNEKEKLFYIENLINNGKNIALTSDRGMPIISDPGFLVVRKILESKIENVRYQAEKNIKPEYVSNITCIPGASAITTAFVLSNLGEKFTFWGFIKKNKEIEEIWNESLPVVIFESPKRIEKTLENFKKLGNRKIVICKDLTKRTEKIIYGELKNLPDFEKLGEFTIILEGNKFNLSLSSLQTRSTNYNCCLIDNIKAKDFSYSTTCCIKNFNELSTGQNSQLVFSQTHSGLNSILDKFANLHCNKKSLSKILSEIFSIKSSEIYKLLVKKKD